MEYPERPVAAASMLVVRRGRVLLVRRRFPPSPGFWALPGGKVELGETVAEAAVREVFEECGIRTAAREVLTVVDLLVPDGERMRFHFVLAVCRGVYLEGEPSPSGEVTAAAWIDLAQVDDLPLTDATRDVIRTCTGKEETKVMPVRAHVIVRGKVQGVWFRVFTRDEAQVRGVSGWVRNRPDGSVEMVAQGDRPAVEALIAWCRQGPPRARVEQVAVAWEEYVEGPASFEIR